MTQTHYARAVRRLPIAAAVALSFAQPAHALLITDDLNVNGEAVAVGNMSSTYAQSGTTSAGGSTNSFSPGGDANANSFANNGGRYVAVAGATGVASSFAAVDWTRTVANDTGIAQEITFDAFLYGGNLFANGPNSSASYDWSISFTKSDVTTSIFASDVFIDGSTVTENNGLGSGSGTGYFWSSRTLSDVSLGVLDANESLTINYSLLTRAMSDNAAFDRDACFGDGYGGDFDGYGGQFETRFVREVQEDEIVRELVPVCFPGASTFTGDPSNVAASPIGPMMITGTPVIVTAVDEPLTLGLLGLGVLGAAATRRPRR